MKELGNKDDVLGVDKLKPIIIYSKPDKMPLLEEDESVIGGLHRSVLYETLYWCDQGLTDMQALYDAYARGAGTRLSWYKGKDVGFIETHT